MWRLAVVGVLCLCVLLGAGCKKDESNPSNAEQGQFVDKLTMGIGISGFTITGETASFTRLGGTVMVYWRLESATDMAGSSVKIRIDKQGTAGFAAFDSVSYSNPQSYGHIMLSSFSLGSAGNFRATGILVASGRNVASKDFVVN